MIRIIEIVYPPRADPPPVPPPAAEPAGDDCGIIPARCPVTASRGVAWAVQPE